MVISVGVLFGKVGTLTTMSQKVYGEAGAVAEESISSIRTVASFTGETRVITKYDSKVHEAEKFGVSVGLAIARGVGK